MKREIKFRVWNTKEKKMIVHFKHARIDYVLEYWETNMHVSEPMQFTGLKDKNGKEIYDKDKLIYRDESGELRTGFVEWCDYQWVIIATCGDDEGNQDLEMHPDYSGDWEVIGNYYQGEVLRNSSPPVQTSNSTSLTSDKPKGFNMGDKVSATPTPKEATLPSHHPNIKLNSVPNLLGGVQLNAGGLK